MALPDMRTDIYERGVTVAIVHSRPADDIEAWVVKVRELSKVEAVDWHFIGGRGRVAALGTLEELRRVCAAIRELTPEFNAAVEAADPEFYRHRKPECVYAYYLEATS